MDNKRKENLVADVEDTIGVGWYRTYAEAAEQVISRGQTSQEEAEYLRQETARWDEREAKLFRR
jgi:hypothetical protein